MRRPRLEDMLQRVQRAQSSSTWAPPISRREARMRMTRIPKGADLVLNEVSGAPGFWIRQLGLPASECRAEPLRNAPARVKAHKGAAGLRISIVAGGSGEEFSHLHAFGGGAPVLHDNLIVGALITQLVHWRIMSTNIQRFLGPNSSEKRGSRQNRPCLTRGALACRLG
jgi:hypothetical protein